MDRTTVRLILLVIGLCVIAGIYLWGRHGKKLKQWWLSRSGVEDGDDEPAPRPRESAGRQEPRFSPDDLGDDDLSLSANLGYGQSRDASTEAGKSGGVGAPFLIQLSVVAQNGQTFAGEELRDALLDLDLIHGDMGIFHRYDAGFRDPLFSVASLVKPGTFPIKEMASFNCPGLILFFQPAKVSEPLAVFDDMTHTCRELASRLDGIEWDENRQPLSPAKLRTLRDQLAEACEQA